MALSARYYPSDYVTVTEYLKREETAETKSEYVDGKIIAMAGTSLPHNDISLNVAFAMRSQFGDRPCRANVSDIRVKVSANRFRYPDVVALYGRPEIENTKPPSLLNPQVLVEVLSDSTERIDLVTKLNEYSRFATLTDYILIAQDRREVLHYAHENGEAWTVRTHTEPGDTLNIVSTGVSMTLTAIYRNVELEAEPEISDNGEANVQNTV